MWNYDVLASDQSATHGIGFSHVSRLASSQCAWYFTTTFFTRHVPSVLERMENFVIPPEWLMSCISKTFVISVCCWLLTLEMTESSTRPEHFLSTGYSAQCWGWLFLVSVWSRSLGWGSKFKKSNPRWQIDPNSGVTFCLGVRAVVQVAGVDFVSVLLIKPFWSQGCPGADGGFWRAGIPDLWQTRRIWHRSDLAGKDLTKVEDFQTLKKKKNQKTLKIPWCPWGLQLIYGSETGKMRAGLASAGAWWDPLELPLLRNDASFPQWEIVVVVVWQFH